MAKASRRNQGGQPNPHSYARDREWVAERDRHSGSGAAGVHADQNTRKSGVPYTNRANTRSAAKKRISEDGW